MVTESLSDKVDQILRPTWKYYNFNTSPTQKVGQYQLLTSYKYAIIIEMFLT